MPEVPREEKKPTADDALIAHNRKFVAGAAGVEEFAKILANMPEEEYHKFLAIHSRQKSKDGVK